jgi:hypothetical protein
MRCRATGWPDSPHPFTAADRAAGHRHDLSILQAEFSLTQMRRTDLGSDLPRAGHPRQLRHLPPRSGRSRLRRFRTRVITAGVTPSLHVDDKHTTIKQ